MNRSLAKPGCARLGSPFDFAQGRLGRLSPHVPAQDHPAQDSHQHHGETDGVEDVNAQQIALGRPSPGDDVLLHPEQQAEGENLRAAADGRARDLAGRQVLSPQFIRDEGKRNSCQEEKQRRGKGSAQLRVHEEAALARRAAQPRVIAVSLKHQDAGQPAHPVDVGEARFRGVGRMQRLDWDRSDRHGIGHSSGSIRQHENALLGFSILRFCSEYSLRLPCVVRSGERGALLANKGKTKIRLHARAERQPAGSARE
jgi:hypothetical protein